LNPVTAIWLSSSNDANRHAFFKVDGLDTRMGAAAENQQAMPVMPSLSVGFLFFGGESIDMKGWASLALGTSLFFSSYFDTVAVVKRRYTVHELSPDISSNCGCRDECWTLTAELRTAALCSLSDDSETFRLCKIEARPGLRARLECYLFPQLEVLDLRNWIGFNGLQAVLRLRLRIGNIE
jgi:hypothetical protein